MGQRARSELEQVGVVLPALQDLVDVELVIEADGDDPLQQAEDRDVAEIELAGQQTDWA